MLTAKACTVRRPLGMISAALLAVALCGGGVSAAAGQSGATPAPARVASVAATHPEGSTVEALERTTIERVNEERRAEGITPLVISPELCRLARAYSRDMVERNFFSHVDPDGRMVFDRAERAGITNWSNVGENIARNRGFDDPVGVAVREWMKSQAHRDVLLDTHYRETGLGIWIAPDHTVYFTEIFLTRQ